MPEEKELAAEEEEEEEKPQAAGVSQEDFNKWKSTMDRQVAEHRRTAESAKAELERLRGQYSVLEKAIFPKGFDLGDEAEEEEEEESPFGEKKAKSKKEVRRLHALQERTRQLEDELAKERGKAEIQKRIDSVLTITGVSRNDPELDWASDETDPEMGFGRFQSSAMQIAMKRGAQKQEIRAKVDKKKEELPPKVELGGPKSPVSSFLERAARGEVPKAEMEKVIARARRRTTTGGSELDLKEITS